MNNTQLIDRQYGTVVTSIGTAKIANAALTNSMIGIVKYAIGDGGGEYYMPTPQMTSLKNEIHIGKINQSYIHPENNKIVVIEIVIPQSAPTMIVRECAVFDAEDNMIAIMNTPDTGITQDKSGVIGDTRFVMNLIFSDTQNIKVTTNPTFIYASIEDVKNQKVEVLQHLQTHIDDTNLHVSSLEKQKWNTASELSQTNEGDINALNIKTDQTNVRLNRLEDALFNDVVGNPFLVDFKTLTGIKLIKGCWNKTLQRLEC